MRAPLRLGTTMRAVVWSVICALAAVGGAPPFFADALGAVHPLRVGPDGRHLVRADGRPFFYLADTAWSLFHRLTREEEERALTPSGR
jgi:Protein of unknown function (DUF4038)